MMSQVYQQFPSPLAEADRLEAGGFNLLVDIKALPWRLKTKSCLRCSRWHGRIWVNSECHAQPHHIRHSCHVFRLQS